jgi:hypothetical protein
MDYTFQVLLGIQPVWQLYSETVFKSSLASLMPFLTMFCDYLILLAQPKRPFIQLLEQMQGLGWPAPYTQGR